MKRNVVLPRAIFLMLLAVALVSVAGCSTTDSENASERPWDRPQSWENGLPSTMMEGR